jgi:MipA family protein
MFRFGPIARFVRERSNSEPELRGFRDVPWGVEAGAFADFFPTAWLRTRAELRQGFRAHEGLRADFSADAFADVTPDLRLSGGPRISFASGNFLRTYFGVDASNAALSGLSVYRPQSGLHSAGFGGALTWRATEKVTTSMFGEYTRLLGPTANSGLVRQRGNANQFLMGVSATYRFDFSL